MCGHISIYYKNKKADEIFIRQLTEKIIHRGPDDTGYFIKDNIAFGFNRLSIIDLEFGNQPFQKDNRTIVFNGEIYNHNELRAELIRSNEFTTNSDTEVLLTSYINYGEKCLDKLRGMFAFVIYDEVKDIVFGARDHFGIKPLYYVNNDEFIAFSSEYKSLVTLIGKVNVDKYALQNYLSCFLHFRKTFVIISLKNLLIFQNFHYIFNGFFQLQSILRNSNICIFFK